MLEDDSSKGITQPETRNVYLCAEQCEHRPVRLSSLGHSGHTCFLYQRTIPPLSDRWVGYLKPHLCLDTCSLRYGCLGPVTLKLSLGLHNFLWMVMPILTEHSPWARYSVLHSGRLAIPTVRLSHNPGLWAGEPRPYYQPGPPRGRSWCGHAEQHDSTWAAVQAVTVIGLLPQGQGLELTAWQTQQPQVHGVRLFLCPGDNWSWGDGESRLIWLPVLEK